MKRNIFGVMLMIIGAVMCITATTLFAVSAQDSSGNTVTNDNSQQENKVYTGEYYLDGDSSATKITISDNDIILPDGTVMRYTLSVWKDMPITNEKTGQITYYDYCFLKTSTEKLRYFPAEKEVEIEGRVYKMC